MGDTGNDSIRIINNEELMEQVYIMHFLDILFSNSNRYCSSFCFIVNEDNTGTLELISNNYSFKIFI